MSSLFFFFSSTALDPSQKVGAGGRGGGKEMGARFFFFRADSEVGTTSTRLCPPPRRDAFSPFDVSVSFSLSFSNLIICFELFFFFAPFFQSEATRGEQGGGDEGVLPCPLFAVKKKKKDREEKKGRLESHYYSDCGLNLLQLASDVMKVITVSCYRLMALS